MKLGTMVSFDEMVGNKIKAVSELGFQTCQISGWNEKFFTDDYAQVINEACQQYNIEVSAFWCGWSAPIIWNFTEGPITLGLVPAEYRLRRLEELKRGSAFAKKIGVSYFVTHVGFIPEDMNCENYKALISALKELVETCRANNQVFLFETGQETPTTLARTIQDIGYDNVGVNLDPANLLLYGKANPVDALDLLGKYVGGVHAKDGEYPTDGNNLGEEKPLGEGRVNFPKFIKKLKEAGYQGPITIEREISGEKQTEDILSAKKMLEALIGEV